MPNFNEYPLEATPTDDDTLLMYEVTSKRNRQVQFGSIWDWIKEKLKNISIEILKTKDKTVFGSINELYLNSLPVEDEVSMSEKDFNNITKNGIYGYNQSPESLGVSNCPSQKEGYLSVRNVSGIVFQCYIDSIGTIYTRVKNSTSFSEWKQH